MDVHAHGPGDARRVHPQSEVSRDLGDRGSLPDASYRFDGRRYTLSDLHRRTNTTSFLVVHRGRVLTEEYPGRFAAPGVRFQAFSLTKSVTSLLIGIALDRGDRLTQDPVVVYFARSCGGLVTTVQASMTC